MTKKIINTNKQNEEDKEAVDLSNKKTTISSEIQFESVKKADEFLEMLRGRYNL